MIFPFIKLTQIYNDESAEKYERAFWILPELVEYFTPFEICVNGTTFSVKEDDKEIKKKIKTKLDEMSQDDKISGGGDD